MMNGILVQRPAAWCGAMLACLSLICPPMAQRAFGDCPDIILGVAVYDVPPCSAPLFIGSDTRLNLFEAGRIGTQFLAGAVDGSSMNVEVNVFGGTVNNLFRANGGSIINVSGGEVGDNFQANAGSMVNISGQAVVRSGFTAHTGSTVNVRGGTIGPNFQVFEGSTVHITGGMLESGFEIPAASVVTISGGSVGNGLVAKAGSSLTISGGMVGGGFIADDDSVVTITGGSIGDGFTASFGSEVNISHTGSIADNLRVRRDATVNLDGGAIGESAIADGESTLNVTGGSIGDNFKARFSSHVNLFGTQFFLGDTDITPTLLPNVPRSITDRDVALRGVLEDGSPFDFYLSSVNPGPGAGRDFFDVAAMLTVTLMRVPGLPGDTNSDHLVNIDDLNNVRNHFGAMGAADGTLTGDAFPFDGSVNIDDLNAVRNNFGARLPAPVPEPASAVLLLAALLLIQSRSRPHSAR